MITFIDEKGTEHSALVAYSVTNAVNGELSVKGTIYTNDKVLHGIDRGWRFRLDDEYYRIIYAKPNDTGRQIEVEFDAVHQFFYDMSKSMVYTTLNGSKPFETYLQAIFSNSGYTYNLETTVGSIRKENFGNKSRLSLFNDIIKAAGLEFSVRGHVVRILKRIGTDLSTIVRKDFNMNELKIEKDINSFVTYQRGLGAWKDDEDHSKGRYESEYESPLAKIYGRIEAEPVVDERYKETGKLLERLKENVDKSYKVSVEIDMEDLSQAGYRMSRPNPGDYIMAINENLGFRQKVRIVSFASEYDVGGNLISRKVICNDIGTVQRATSEISHLSRTLTDSIEGSERALKTATRALVSADGKNTNYFGDVKPLDVPKGTLRKGDRLFLTVGDETELYFWSGSEWVIEPTRFDKEKFNVEFDKKAETINKSIQQAESEAATALATAGANALLIKETQKISEQTKKQLDLQFADYKQSVDGRFASMSTRVDGKANQTDFQRVQETSKLYERIIGSNENDISNKVARMALTSQLFQIEIAKNIGSDNNLIVRSKSMDRYTLVNEGNTKRVFVNNGIFTIKCTGNSGYTFAGFTLPLYIDRMARGETYTLNFKYRIMGRLDHNFVVVAKNHQANEGIFFSNIAISSTAVSTEWKEFTETYNITKDFEFGDNKLYPLYFYLAKNGWIEIKEIMLVRASQTNGYKASQFDDMSEAIRTVQSQLAGSWSVQNINSAGDLISGLNLGSNGHNRLSGKLTHITGETLIDNAVIKSAMIESVLADKITAGTLNAANVNIINLNANKIVGLDATFLRGKIENAIIDWLKGKTIASQNGSTTLNLQTGVFTLDNEGSSITFSRSSDNTKTEFNKDGINFLKNQKVIAKIGQSFFVSIYENDTRRGFCFELPNDRGAAFSDTNRSSFFEINPNTHTLAIQSGFSLLIGSRTSQSVSLEHVFGTQNNVNFSGFRAKGTRRQELRFYADGRIEITRG